MTLKLPPPTSCSNPVESQFVETFTRYFVPMICLSCPIAAFCHWFAGVHRKSTNAQDRCLAPVCHCWGGSQKLNKWKIRSYIVASPSWRTGALFIMSWHYQYASDLALVQRGNTHNLRFRQNSQFLKPLHSNRRISKLVGNWTYQLNGGLSAATPTPSKSLFQYSISLHDSILIFYSICNISHFLIQMIFLIYEIWKPCILH